VVKLGIIRKIVDQKNVDKSKGFDDAPSIEGKASLEEGGDVYLASTSTHSDHDAWLINSGASFHMTPHREWFCEYEKYNGGCLPWEMTQQPKSQDVEGSVVA
jgi:hypothetical protein